MLTLTGTGGIGKTRLAVRVAAEVANNYRDRVWLVELAALTDGTLLPQLVAAVFGIREPSRQPLLDSLVGALRTKQALLLLDNCEHLLPACADFATTLLKICPLIRILATSREGMNVSGEVCWRVPSLALPKADAPSSELLDAEALQLFTDRARAVLPGFASSGSEVDEVQHQNLSHFLLTRACPQVVLGVCQCARPGAPIGRVMHLSKSSRPRVRGASATHGSHILAERGPHRLVIVVGSVEVLQSA
ncbi:MAG TPA: AAA family ATPase [Chloroflexota bacterium]